MAKGKKTGGRQRGSKNKAPSKAAVAAQVADKAAEAGLMPLDYMLDLMRKPIPENLDAAVKVSLQGLRFEAAKAAAPYCHARLQAVEHSGKGGLPIDLKWVVEIVRPRP